jgi:hypothetical protein
MITIKLMKTKIEYLASLCREDVTIWVNDYYRGAGETIRTHIKDRGFDTPEDVITEMEKRNIIVTVQAYPNSQVSSYVYSHYDIEVALDTVIQWIEQERRQE